jgi:hypothetical protein
MGNQMTFKKVFLTFIVGLCCHVSFGVHTLTIQPSKVLNWRSGLFANEGNNAYLIIKDDDRVVGWVLVCKEVCDKGKNASGEQKERTLENIYSLYVCLGSRAGGYGTTLFSVAKHILRLSGCEKIVWGADAYGYDNEPPCPIESLVNFNDHISKWTVKTFLPISKEQGQLVEFYKKRSTRYYKDGGGHDKFELESTSLTADERIISSFLNNCWRKHIELTLPIDHTRESTLAESGQSCEKALKEIVEQDYVPGNQKIVAFANTFVAPFFSRLLSSEEKIVKVRAARDQDKKVAVVESEIKKAAEQSWANSIQRFFSRPKNIVLSVIGIGVTAYALYKGYCRLVKR